MQIIIPYLENYELGKAYNQAMETVEDWVLFIDDDVFLATNPNYYSICKQFIKEVGHKAGFVTCKTNAIGCGTQIVPDAPLGHDLTEHIAFSKKIWKSYGSKYKEINCRGGLLSGFFMLTHKKAWEDAGGFISGFYGVDNDYHERVITCGYKAYIFEGLYLYHMWKTKL